ncbi:MAG TPA: 4Fe-4S dicluster domain-containing protein [Deltaproteobacteria bacterium]|nr:4Fe-4S dicluster domain-containing protein [Deltaproteobacteria bacterium]
MVAVVDERACKGCGTCVDACPQHAISAVNDVAGIDARPCLGCAECIDSCPFGAISMVHNDNQRDQDNLRPTRLLTHESTLYKPLQKQV